MKWHFKPRIFLLCTFAVFKAHSSFKFKHMLIKFEKQMPNESTSKLFKKAPSCSRGFKCADTIDCLFAITKLFGNFRHMMSEIFGCVQIFYFSCDIR